MKDLRSPRDPRELTVLLHGASRSDGGTEDEGEMRRAQRRRRTSAALVIGIVLAVVIGPHLIDGTRVSSVADRAAAGAGGLAVQPVSCPGWGSPGGVSAVPEEPVVLESAVLCRYRRGAAGASPQQTPVPVSQLPALNADLQAHSARVGGVGAEQDVAAFRPTGSQWTLVGVTQQGQRVALTVWRYPDRYVWAGAGPRRVWRPAPAVQQMLAADLPTQP